MDNHVTEPLPGKEAFESTADAAALTQAAVLLIIGSQLRGAVKEADDDTEILPPEDLNVLGVPPLTPEFGRIDSERIRMFLNARYGISVTTRSEIPEEAMWRRDIFADLASNHFRSPTATTAANLMEACLRHPHELVRVSAAAAYHDRSSETSRLTEILDRGTHSSNLLVRDIAATALAHLAPEHPRLSELQPRFRRAAGGQGQILPCSFMVHGLPTLIGGDQAATFTHT